MRALRLGTSLLLTTLALVLRVSAEPTFLLHAMPSDFSACDALDARSMRCGDDFNVAPSSSDDYFAWVIVGDVSAVTGAIFGVSYESTVNVATWVGCTPLQIPEPGWPASGSGAVVAWECLQTSSNKLVKVGFFYVTSGSTGGLSIAPHPRPVTGPALAISDCNSAFDVACEYNGRLVFGGAGGYLPTDCRCSGPPAVESSWSAIKAQYRDP